MRELRKDYILDRFCIISEARGKRPFEFRESEEIIFQTLDVFSPGNEELTPTEIYRKGDEEWNIRVIPNKFAAVELEGQKNISTANYFYTHASAFGNHEIVVETRHNTRNYDNFSIEEIREILKVFSERIEKIEENEHVKYVQVFKNKGKNAGTSIVHSHSQLIGFNIIPPIVKEKVEKSFVNDECEYCKIINAEKDSDRKILETSFVSAFCMYCSIQPFHAIIFPKRHVERLKDLSEEEYYDIAKAISMITKKLRTLNASYNLVLHYAPKNENLHLQLEIIPRMSTWGGFELGTNTYILHISPESAARFYREA